MAVNGSLEYVLTWKSHTMPSGGPICALRARARPTFDNGYGGWPTPMAGSPGTATYNPVGNTDNSRKTVALLAGWSTPTVPRLHDSNLSAFRWNPNKKQDDPCMQMLGRDLKLSDVPMEKRAALNPAFCRWLMGYPIAWDGLAGTGTRSSRRLPRNSSVPVSKP